MRWDREKLPKPDLHVYSESGMKIMVYNMKMYSKKEQQKEKQRKRKLKKYNSKRKNSMLLITLF